MKRAFLVLLTLCFLSSGHKAADSTPIDAALKRETFEYIWHTVNRSYFDPNFNGVDWKAVHDRYKPQVERVETVEEFHALMDRMVKEIGVSHFKVMTKEEFAVFWARPRDSAATGLSLRWIDNELLVTGVRPDSPAARAGIAPGYSLITIDAMTPKQILAESMKATAGYRRREEVEIARSVQRHLSGKPGTTITLEVEDPKGKTRKVELARADYKTELEFEHRILAGNIGYMAFSVFFGNLYERFTTAMKDLQATDGLVIDLRGNPGGLGHLAPALASHLNSRDGSLGKSRFRNDVEEFDFIGRGERAYSKPIVILVDEMTGSTSEVFTGGLKDLGRVTVVGKTTAGAVLPSRIDHLKTGGVLQHVISCYETPKGIVLEGRGIEPDVKITHTRKALLQGRDLMLERAVETLKPRAVAAKVSL